MSGATRPAAPQVTTDSGTDSGTGARRWLAVCVLSVCVLLPFMDITTTSLDLPKITRELSITWGEAQWVVGGYMLAAGVGMLLVPSIGRRWGYRRTLLAGLTLFGAGAVVAAWASGPEVFIAARVVMGLGAATVLPARVSITTAMFPAEHRRRAFAIGAASTSAAAPFGLIAAGVLLDHSWYGSLFLVDAVIVVLVLPFIVWLTPETPTVATSRPDLPGIVLATGAAVAVFGGFLVAPNSRPVAVCLIVAVLLLAGFAVRQRAAANPLLDLAVLHNRTFLWSQLTISLVNLAWTGLLFLVPTYFLVVRGFSALGVALLLVPLAGMASVGSLVTDRLTRRLGVRWTVITGLLVFAAGLGLLSTLTPRSGLPLVVVALLLSGFGAGLPQAPALVTALGALPERSAANGPGVVNALRHIGGAFGVAAGGLVVATVYLRGLPAPGVLSGPADDAARASVVNVADAADEVRTNAYAAFTHGVSMAMVGGAVLFVGLAVLAMALSERPSQRDDQQADDRQAGDRRAAQ